MGVQNKQIQNKQNKRIPHRRTATARLIRAADRTAAPNHLTFCIPPSAIPADTLYSKILAQHSQPGNATRHPAPCKTRLDFPRAWDRT